MNQPNFTRSLFTALVLSTSLAGTGSFAKDPPAPKDEQPQLNFTLESILDSLTTFNFAGKIKVDSRQKDSLQVLEVYLDSELKSTLIYKLNKSKADEAAAPSSQDKKPAGGVMAQDILLRVGKPGLRISASAIKNNSEVVTTVRFKERAVVNGKAKLTDSFIEFFIVSSKRGEMLSFRLKGVDFRTTGIFGDLKTIEVKGECNLLQKTFVINSTGTGETGFKYTPTECKYEMFYNKETHKFDYTYSYNSLDPVIPAQ